MPLKTGAIRVEPVVLEGEHVRLEPLALSHLDGLCEIGIVEALWRWIPTQVETREQMKAYIELALTEALALTAAFAKGTRIEAIFSPLASLATLAFLAVFKVLIRDFFWIDIASSSTRFFVL